MTGPNVAIVVLNYNGREDTLACLQSLAGLNYASVHTIVVDNDSHDGSVAAFRSAYPHLEVIETGKNLGFAGGNNHGIRAALQHGAEYVLILNNDTIVDPDLVSALVAACEADPTIGVAGPKIYYHDEPTTLWSAGGEIDWQCGLSHMRGINCLDTGQFESQEQVDFVTGCAMLVRRSAIEAAGLLDDRFGMYFEETEWCVRITRAGWRIVYVPTARLWHKIRPRQQAESPAITYYMARNRLLFLHLTHAPLRAWFHALILQDLRTWCSWRLRRRWSGKAAQRAALVRAWSDYRHHRFGMVRLSQ